MTTHSFLRKGTEIFWVSWSGNGLQIGGMKKSVSLMYFDRGKIPIFGDSLRIGESAKSSAWRDCVFACFACLHAYDLASFACLLAWHTCRSRVLVRLCACRGCVLTYLRDWHAPVLTFRVVDVLACFLPYIFIELILCQLKIAAHIYKSMLTDVNVQVEIVKNNCKFQEHFFRNVLNLLCLKPQNG